MSTTTPTSSETGSWTAIAKLLRPQGRRGELLAEPLTDLAGVFVKGRAVRLAASAPKPAVAAPERVLEDCWSPTGRNAGRMVLKLSGCDSINDAEALAGCEVLIAAAEMPALDEDTFFVGDLVGCAFFDGDQQVGTVVDLEFPVSADGHRLEDAAPLLVVEIAGDEEPVLVPFVRAWLEAVDLNAKRVTMHLPEGLIGGEGTGEEEAEDDTGSDDAV
ncbi:ribosome maturation factor RimM [Granulicella sp. 5B5]|uniref:ribosome maturation factor RimM n=1 Tax=Granulicella sp. 5B5 TaxID=1617967 RepID=UPI0015F4F8C6|nr:ribosome maturation factor RimM [Granulicella sp. 5B5]